MSESLLPFSIEQLADVDVAKCAYSTKLSEIVGIVEVETQGGFLRCPHYKVHMFGFVAWRHVQQSDIRHKLTILRPVADWSKEMFTAFPAGSIHRLRVLLSTDETRAVVAELLPVAGDEPELRAVARKLEEPITFSSLQFGELLLNRRIGWFEGEMDWCGVPIELHIICQTIEDLPALLGVAEGLWNAEANWNRRILEFAVQELLELKNRNWRVAGERKVSAKQFQSRMSLVSVSIRCGELWEFWYEDDGLFSGHAIVVRGSLKDGPTESDISG